eukprot:COSAG05_NODE_377_length_10608_cov_17.523361_8_plen_95_part_00
MECRGYTRREGSLALLLRVNPWHVPSAAHHSSASSSVVNSAMWMSSPACHSRGRAEHMVWSTRAMHVNTDSYSCCIAYALMRFESNGCAETVKE